MSRARKLGALALALACAGLVAGCGAGGGTTDAVEAPAAGTAAPPAAGAAPASTPAPGSGATNVIGAFAPADEASLEETIKGYDRFPRTRAGKIFTDPTVKPAAPAAPAAADPATTGVTAVPATSATPAGSTEGTAPAPAPVVTELVASIDVSGVLETARVGGQIPAASPQFTVESITTQGVTLKVNTGTFPGGSQTMEVKVGEPITLTNATTGVALTITVKTITPQAKTA